MKRKKVFGQVILILIIAAIGVGMYGCRKNSQAGSIKPQNNITQSSQYIGVTDTGKAGKENPGVKNELQIPADKELDKGRQIAGPQMQNASGLKKGGGACFQTNQKEGSNPYQNTELAGNVKTAMDKAVNYIYDYYSSRKGAGIADWPVIALRSAGENLKADRWKGKIDEAFIKREIEIKNEVDFDARRATDYQKTILTLVSSGRNPQNYSGKNWLSIIKQSQQKNGKFADSVGEGGNNLINAHVWGIISLCTAGEEIPDKQKAYDWLVQHQNSDGGFGIDISSKTSDIDMTGMSLIALGMMGKTGKDRYVQKALGYLELQQLENGGFKLWGEENPESAAAVMQGLIAVGENPMSERWNKGNGNNIISFILSFQLPDGSLKHTRGGGSDMMATYKSLMALGDFYYKETIFKRIRA